MSSEYSALSTGDLCTAIDSMPPAPPPDSSPAISDSAVLDAIKLEETESLSPSPVRDTNGCVAMTITGSPKTPRSSQKKKRPTLLTTDDSLSDIKYDLMRRSKRGAFDSPVSYQSGSPTSAEKTGAFASPEISPKSRRGSKSLNSPSGSRRSSFENKPSTVKHTYKANSIMDRAKQLSVNDYHFLKTIGKGAFAEVKLAAKLDEPMKAGCIPEER